MQDFELIVGVHSIKAALQNPNRNNLKVYLTDESSKDFKLELKSFEGELIYCSTHKLQEKAKEYYSLLGFEYQRVPSGAFLISSPLVENDINDLYELAAQRGKKILCLDQVSDVHNGAAILRTASFYGVDAVILPARKSFNYTPGYFRISSGAHEHLNLFHVNNLSKTLKKLQSLRVKVIGLSEHADTTFRDVQVNLGEGGSLALVLGKEETGISNAVTRVLDHKVALNPMGNIRSLNVSVAAAISLEKCFGN